MWCKMAINNIKVGDRIEDEETEGDHFDWVVKEVHEDHIIGKIIQERSFRKEDLVLAPERHSRKGIQYFREVYNCIGRRIQNGY